MAAKICERPLVVSFNGDWAPFFYAYGNDKYDGIDYQLLTNVTKSLGCQIAVLPMTEARTIIELKKGTYDVSMGASYTHERQQSFHFSSAYREEKVGIVIAQGKQHNSDTRLRDILESGGIVGINISGYFGDTVESLKAQFSSQFVHGFSLSERIRMLTQGDVQAIVDDRTALCVKLKSNPALLASQAWQDQQGQVSLLLTKEVLHRDDIHFMFSKHTVDNAFVTRFNTHLSTLLQQQSTISDCAVTL